MRLCWIYSQLRIKSKGHCMVQLGCSVDMKAAARLSISCSPLCSNHCLKTSVLSCGQSFITWTHWWKFPVIYDSSHFLKLISSRCHAGDDRSISETDDCGANETNLRFVHFIHQVYHLLVNLTLNKWQWVAKGEWNAILLNLVANIHL